MTDNRVMHKRQLIDHAARRSRADWLDRESMTPLTLIRLVVGQQVCYNR
jgi:hypothetical protein